MRIGIVGRGRMGTALKDHLDRLGHDVETARSSGPDVVREAEVVFLALPYAAVDDVAAGAGWEGKLVVDLTNFYAGRDGDALDPAPVASSVVVASKLPGARVVKAYNTIAAAQLASQGGREPRRALPVAGDDAEAKAQISELVDDMGFAPVDAGSLADSTRQQPGSPVYNADLDAAGVRAALAAGAA